MTSFFASYAAVPRSINASGLIASLSCQVRPLSFENTNVLLLAALFSRCDGTISLPYASIRIGLAWLQLWPSCVRSFVVGVSWRVKLGAVSCGSGVGVGSAVLCTISGTEKLV